MSCFQERQCLPLLGIQLYTGWNPELQTHRKDRTNLSNTAWCEKGSDWRKPKREAYGGWVKEGLLKEATFKVHVSHISQREGLHSSTLMWMSEQKIHESHGQCLGYSSSFSVDITVCLNLTTKKCKCNLMKGSIINLTSVENPLGDVIMWQVTSEGQHTGGSHMVRLEARDSGAMFFVLLCFLTIHWLSIKPRFHRNSTGSTLSDWLVVHLSWAPPSIVFIITIRTYPFLGPSFQHVTLGDKLYPNQSRATLCFVLKARADFYFWKNGFSRNPNKILCITLRVPKRMGMNTDSIGDWKQSEGMWGN